MLLARTGLLAIATHWEASGHRGNVQRADLDARICPHCGQIESITHFVNCIAVAEPRTIALELIRAIAREHGTPLTDDNVPDAVAAILLLATSTTRSPPLVLTMADLASPQAMEAYKARALAHSVYVSNTARVTAVTLVLGNILSPENWKRKLLRRPAPHDGTPLSKGQYVATIACTFLREAWRIRRRRCKQIAQAVDPAH